MLVRDLMNTQVHWISSSMPVREAAKMMRDNNVGALPIAENDKLIGMLTDRDIVVRALAGPMDVDNVTVKDAMSEKMLYCVDEQSVADVAQNMGENQVRRLAVVNSDKNLVGFISLGDIATHASELTAGQALGEISEARP